MDNATVVLEARPNPDYTFGHRASIYIARHQAAVSSVAEAKAAVRNFISDNDLGAGNWTGGQVFSDGIRIGTISYNGHFWPEN